jgi:hypothetical protein
VTAAGLWQRWRATVAGGVLIAGLAALFTGRPLPQPVRFELGSFDGAWCAGGWGRAGRARLRESEARDGRLDFYYRTAGVNSRVALPLVAGPGRVRLTLRATVPVRSGVNVAFAGRPAGETILVPEPWDDHDVEVAPAVGSRALDVAFALQPLPLVRGDRAESPRLDVDSLTLEAEGGLRLAGRERLLAVLLPLGVALLLRGAGLGAGGALGGAGVVAALCAALLWAAPLATSAALARLVPLALATGLVALALLRRAGAPPADARWLMVLVAAGTAFHGALAFFPDHNPPDVDIHVRRTADLAEVPLEYGALLRYSSQLPTASQDRGAATAALGDGRLIPYSPLPYVLYHLASVAGVDLYWALTGLNAAFAMLVAPWMWLVAREVWGREAAWLATLLYSLDLATWHHLGRAHAPAVIGSAMGTAALLFLVREAGRLDSRRRVLGAGVVLALGVLGYSSLAVLIGLFGVALLALLAVVARPLGRDARVGSALALVTGGLIAGALFYGHYVPGFLGGPPADPGPDLFPGRSFFIFNNESRQSYRIWLLGYWIPLLAGLVALPFALRAARPAARHVLVAWALAWGMIMLLKEPWLFPRLLRWAKEDQFLSPLLVLLVAGALGAIPHRGLRRSLAAVTLVTALWLQLRDYGHHAVSLRL